MIFRVIIILISHHFTILKLFHSIKFFILNQIKQIALKSGYGLCRIYGKFIDIS